MIKILLTCSGGMSTSIIETKLRKYFRQNKLDMEVAAMAEGAARPHIQEYNIVLIAPQVKYLLNNFKNIAKDIPVVVMSPQDYGLGNVDNIMKLIKDTLHIN